MTEKFTRQGLDIAILQEPYCKGKFIQFLKGGELIYDKKIFSNNDRQFPRACLMVNKKLNPFLLNDFCFRDLIAVNLSIGKRKFVVCSVYVENESLDVLNKMKDLVDFCKKKNVQLILGGDFNAHHINWGSDNDNLRGEIVMDFIGTSGLFIHNQGSRPTFTRTNCSTIIDLTLSSQFISHKIRNWNVLNEFTGSDHKYISFELVIDENINVKTRCPRKTNWEGFRSSMKKKNFKREREFQ